MSDGKPCKNCPNRKVGCHSSCQIYIDFRKEMDKNKHTKVNTYYEYKHDKMYFGNRHQRVRSAK